MAKFTPEQMEHADALHRVGWSWEHVADVQERHEEAADIVTNLRRTQRERPGSR